MKWKIFYSESTYSDEDGPPELAPKRDVQMVIVRDQLSGRRLEHGSDYYIYVPERGVWRGVERFGLFDYLIDPGVKIVLFGRVLSNIEYRKMVDRALKDHDFPDKSAWHKEEKR